MFEWIDLALAFVVGLALRFGIPMTLTALLVWWLRRLDLGWQSEAEQTHRLQIEHLLVSRAACWDAKQCTPEQRAHCPAYGRRDKACWQIVREIDGRLPERCLACEVFRNAPAPAVP